MNEDSIRQATAEDLEGRMGYLKTSKQSGVPRRTIEARIKVKRQGRVLSPVIYHLL